MNIRHEHEHDRDTISEITKAAFETLAVSNHTEQYIIRALRESGALAISLVAEEVGAVVGHVAFSPVAVSDGSQGWYGLGPLSVKPDHQNRGIGSALVKRGLFLLKGLGAGGCVLVGEPGYYGRFGFRHIPGLTCEGVPDQYVLALPFAGEDPQGVVTFHPAFFVTE
jgi:putative acetyltransferase